MHSTDKKQRFIACRAGLHRSASAPGGRNVAQPRALQTRPTNRQPEHSPQNGTKRNGTPEKRNGGNRSSQETGRGKGRIVHSCTFRPLSRTACLHHKHLPQLTVQKYNSCCDPILKMELFGTTFSENGTAYWILTSRFFHRFPQNGTKRNGRPESGTPS